MQIFPRCRHSNGDLLFEDSTAQSGRNMLKFKRSSFSPHLNIVRYFTMSTMNRFIVLCEYGNHEMLLCTPQIFIFQQKTNELQIHLYLWNVSTVIWIVRYDWNIEHFSFVSLSLPEVSTNKGTGLMMMIKGNGMVCASSIVTVKI